MAWTIFHEQDGRQCEQDCSESWRGKNEKGEAVSHYTFENEEFKTTCFVSDCSPEGDFGQLILQDGTVRASTASSFARSAHLLVAPSA